MWLDIGGAATLGVAAEAGPQIAWGIARAFAPYVPGPAHAQPVSTDVAIQPIADMPAFQDIEGAAGDGLVTAFDGSRAFLVRGQTACALPDPINESPAAFAYTPDFPVLELVRSFIRPAVALAGLRHGAVVVHASAVAIDGQAVLIGGWSESGKTEVALGLAEAGAEFLSDKWTIVRSDGLVCPFPASVGIRRWVLPYLPGLRAGLPAAARTQLLGAAGASLVTGPFRRPFRNPILRQAGALSTKLTGLADRAALSLTQVRAIYGNPGDVTTPVPLGLVVLLTTLPPGAAPVSVPVHAGAVARRLAQAAAFERREYFSVTERVRYGGAGDERTDGRAAAEIESDLLRARFEATRLLRLQIPFPDDPRRAVESIHRELEDR